MIRCAPGMREAEPLQIRRQLGRDVARSRRRTSTEYAAALAGAVAPTGPSPPRAGSTRASRWRSVSCTGLRVGARHAFLAQAVFQHQLGHHLRQLGHILAQRADLARRGLSRGIAEQPFLAGLEKLLAPPGVEVRIEPFAATQGREALDAPQSLQDNSNFLLRGQPSPRLPPNIPNDPFC